MKKALLTVCLIFLAVIITACGGGNGTSAPTDNSLFYYLLAQQNSNNQNNNNQEQPQEIDPTVPDLELSKTSYELGLGEEDTVTVTCNGQIVTDFAVYTLDNNLITVEKGNIKALYQAGETTVTVSLEGANSATFTVKVIDDSEGVLILDNDTLDKLFELNLVDTDSEHKSELTKLHFPGAFTYTDGKKYKIINISSGMFANCASLESIEIPNSITTIESNSFGNTPIKEVTIPDSVINLEYAFVGCTSLEKIIIGNGLTEIKDGQFYRFTALKIVIIGNGVTKIGNSAFSDCKNLEKLIIGNSVEKIGYSAFMGTKIEEITIPNSVETIENYAFQGTPIKEITIPDSVTSLGDSTFKDCANLEKVIIGNGLTEIKSNQFSSGVNGMGLTSLKTVTIGNSVKTIDSAAFRGTKIEKITIPNNVTSLGIQVFKDCKSLETVTIGNGVTEINSGAFSGCSLLKLKLPDQVATIGNNAFLGILCIRYPSNLTAIATNPAPDDHWGAQTYEVFNN